MHPTTFNAKAYSAASATSLLASTKINRRDPTDRDVQIEILFCGICHSDLHSVRNEWSEFMATNYPIVPATRLSAALSRSGRQSPSTSPGISPPSAAWSIRTAPVHNARLASRCLPDMILTFNSPDKHLGGVTYGGYSESIVSMNISFCVFRPHQLSCPCEPQ